MRGRYSSTSSSESLERKSSGAKILIPSSSPCDKYARPLSRVGVILSQNRRTSIDMSRTRLPEMSAIVSPSSSEGMRNSRSSCFRRSRSMSLIQEIPIMLKNKCIVSRKCRNSRGSISSSRQAPSFAYKRKKYSANVSPTLIFAIFLTTKLNYKLSKLNLN